jgi:hypothetical protein
MGFVKDHWASTKPQTPYCRQTMDVEEGLKVADKLIYAKTGKHLNDLER